MNIYHTYLTLNIRNNYNFTSFTSVFGYKGYNFRFHFKQRKKNRRQYSTYTRSLNSLHNVNPQFYNPIPSAYVSSKGLPIHLHFTIFQLNSSEFNQIISKYVPIDFVYTVFIKVRYNIDSFFMAGNQFGFDYYSDSDIEQLHDDAMSKLQFYLDEYNLTGDAVVYVQFSFKQSDKTLLSEFSLDKPTHITVSENTITQNKLNIPVSINEDSLGKTG